MGLEFSSGRAGQSGMTNLDMNFLIDHLRLTPKDLAKLVTAFRKIDSNSDTKVSLDEFCEHVHIKPTIFLQNMFGYFSSGDQKLYFAEFVLFIYIFLNLDEVGLAKLMYKVIGITHTRGDFLAETLDRSCRFMLRIATKEDDINWHAVQNDYMDHDPFISEETFVTTCMADKTILSRLGHCQVEIKNQLASRSYWDRKVGIGNKFLPKMRELKDNLQSLLRDQQLVFPAEDEDEEKGIEEVSDGRERRGRCRHRHEAGNRSRSLPREALLTPTSLTPTQPALPHIHTDVAQAPVAHAPPHIGPCAQDYSPMSPKAWLAHHPKHTPLRRRSLSPPGTTTPTPHYYTHMGRGYHDMHHKNRGENGVTRSQRRRRSLSRGRLELVGDNW